MKKCLKSPDLGFLEKRGDPDSDLQNDTDLIGRKMLRKYKIFAYFSSYGL